MTTDRLNFFEPFNRLPSDHENTLTRALLLVLKHSPLAHQAWLDRVFVDQPKRPALYELPSATL